MDQLLVMAMATATGGDGQPIRALDTKAKSKPQQQSQFQEVFMFRRQLFSDAMPQLILCIALN